ncbi:hypothetical protein ACQI4F_11005 [Mycolicibacterium vaccae]|uniref:hypothetical protein n=1 Tax=Mycolicibacterium vaccae TaxID=1810 RepID=UPI003CEAB950
MWCASLTLRASPLHHGCIVRQTAVTDENRRTPRQQRSRETVDTLVDAAAQVFSREGAAPTAQRGVRTAACRCSPFDDTVREVLIAPVALHGDRPRLHALPHRLARPTVKQRDELHSFEDRICDEVAFHLKH